MPIQLRSNFNDKIYILQYVLMENSYQTNRVQTALVIVKKKHLAISWQGCAITDVLITGMELSAIVFINNLYKLCQLFKLFTYMFVCWIWFFWICSLDNVQIYSVIEKSKTIGTFLKFSNKDFSYLKTKWFFYTLNFNC